MTTLHHVQSVLFLTGTLWRAFIPTSQTAIVNKILEQDEDGTPKNIKQKTTKLIIVGKRAGNMSKTFLP